MPQLSLRAALLAVVVPSITVPATANAQLLRVGPLGGVSVRVPFVSVDVSPFGGTRVRAPFTRVQTPDRGYPYHGHIAPYGHGAHHGHGHMPPPGAYGSPVPDFHSPHFFGFPRDYSRVPDYDRDWNYRRDGDYGRDLGMPPVGSGPYLSGPLNSHLNSPLEGAIPESSYRPVVPEIYRPPAPRYHIPSYAEVFPDSPSGGDDSAAAAMDDRDHRGDTYTDATPPPYESAYAFEGSPAETARLANRLRGAADRLQRSFGAFAEGEVWSDYLRCDLVRELADDVARSRSTDATIAPQARSLLANFDGVAANPSLTYVTRLDGFTETRQALTALVTVIEGEDRGAPGIINMDPSEFDGELDAVPHWDLVPEDPRPADAEELPPPRLAPPARPDAPRVFRGEV